MKILVEYEVLEGDYCWNYTAPIRKSICSHFDNEGGHPFCTLFDEDLKRWGKKEDPNGVRKCDKCVRACKDSSLRREK